MKTSNWRLYAVLTAIAAVFAVWVLIGPAPVMAQAPTPAATPAPTLQPKRGGVLKAALLAGVKTLDPHKNPNQSEYWTDQLMYDYLVILDKNLDIKPALATEWKTSSDGLTWTFTLRKGVKFHNGRELKASDVVYSVQRIQDPKMASALTSNYKQVKSVEAPDDYTVVFNLSSPNAVLPTTLADARSAIVAKEVVEKNNGDLAMADAGSGPFRFVKQETDGTVVLERNPDYWDQPLPYLDGLRLMAIPDSTARVTALRTGDVDIASFITTNFISLLSQEKGVQVAEPPVSGQFYYLMFNLKQKPFDDIKVRQAIAYALDRQALTAVSLNNEGYPLLSAAIPPWHWAAAKPYYKPTSDLETAKKLLAESSAPNGFSFDLRIWSSQDYVVRSAQLIQEQLAPLKIVPKISQQGDWGTYWDPVTKGNFQTTIQGTGGNVDPDTWLYETFHTGGGKNYMSYSNPEVDKLLEQGRAEADREKRKGYYDQAQTLIAQDAPMAFLYNMKQTDAKRDYVMGFYHMPTMTFWALRETWLNK
jgi:peptide/nickel transport system substrate-binding protein